MKESLGGFSDALFHLDPVYAAGSNAFFIYLLRLSQPQKTPWAIAVST